VYTPAALSSRAAGAKPRQHRRGWFIQKRADKPSCLERLKAKETAYTLLVARTLLALESAPL
jgi:hypothetical protein